MVCVCLRPSPEQKQSINTQFEIMTVPYYLVRVNYSRGESQWQKDHWKAEDGKLEARKHNQDSIELRWINDAIHRASKSKI